MVGGNYAEPEARQSSLYRKTHWYSAASTGVLSKAVKRPASTSAGALRSSTSEVLLDQHGPPISYSRLTASLRMLLVLVIRPLYTI